MNRRSFLKGSIFASVLSLLGCKNEKRIDFLALGGSSIKPYDFGFIDGMEVREFIFPKGTEFMAFSDLNENRLIRKTVWMPLFYIDKNGKFMSRRNKERNGRLNPPRKAVEKAIKDVVSNFRQDKYSNKNNKPFVCLCRNEEDYGIAIGIITENLKPIRYVMEELNA